MRRNDDEFLEEYRQEVFGNIDKFQEMSTEKKSLVSTIKFFGPGVIFQPKVDEIQIYNDNMIKVIKMFPNLTDLNLCSFPALTDDQIAKLGFVCLEKLEKLNLFDNISLTGKTFARIAGTCKLLSSFSFTSQVSERVHFCYCIKQNDLLSLVAGNKFLKNLFLMVHSVGKEFLHALRDHELESLYLDSKEWCKGSTEVICQILSSPKITLLKAFHSGFHWFKFVSSLHCLKSPQYRYSYFHINNSPDDLLLIDGLNSLIKIHADNVSTFQFHNFVNLTDEVLKTIWVNGSNNVKTIRFVGCDTENLTHKNIIKLTRNCVYFEFLFLDGYGQGGSVTRGKSVGGNVFYVVNRDYKEVVFKSMEKRNDMSQYNKDFLSSETLLEVEMEVRRLEVARLAKLAGDQIDTNGIIGAKREREEEY